MPAPANAQMPAPAAQGAYGAMQGGYGSAPVAANPAAYEAMPPAAYAPNPLQGVVPLAPPLPAAAPPAAAPMLARPRKGEHPFNDAHVHLTNYVQQGPSVQQLLSMMGDHVGRAALLGTPLQQLWSKRVSGDYGPTYHLSADTPLYYYSFSDATLATAYRSLSKAEQARFDPMISGFNPADMYGADHIRRVLETFPGVFTGVGEITIHKEFVSSKIAGEVPSLTDPALDRVLDFCGEVGLVVLIHNDIDVPFPKPDAEPAYLTQMKELLRRHPSTTIIWAHTGVGRMVRPIRNHAATIDSMLADPAFAHVYFDISGEDVARYMLGTQESLEISAALINRNPDRFLFGSDEVGPANQEQLLRVSRLYQTLWASLTPEANEKVRKRNYERLFDDARRKVRAWEDARLKPTREQPRASR
jgi:hypothetical protein